MITKDFVAAPVREEVLKQALDIVVSDDYSEETEKKHTLLINSTANVLISHMETIEQCMLFSPENVMGGLTLIAAGIEIGLTAAAIEADNLTNNQK